MKTGLGSSEQSIDDVGGFKDVFCVASLSGCASTGCNTVHLGRVMLEVGTPQEPGATTHCGGSAR